MSGYEKLRPWVATAASARLPPAPPPLLPPGCGATAAAGCTAAGAASDPFLALGSTTCASLANGPSVWSSAATAAASPAPLGLVTDSGTGIVLLLGSFQAAMGVNGPRRREIEMCVPYCACREAPRLPGSSVQSMLLRLRRSQAAMRAGGNRTHPAAHEAAPMLK